MNRLVCDCLRVYEDSIKKCYKEFNGSFEKIQEKTQAGLACRRCLDKESEEDGKVDISLPSIIDELNKMI